MKQYGELLETHQARAFAARVVDVSELLASVEPARRADRCRCGSSTTTPATSPTPSRSAASRASCCPRSRSWNCSKSPRAGALLRLAGIYNLTQPSSGRVGVRKARHLLATGAEAIAAGKPRLHRQLDLHLRELGHPLPIHHPVELVWRSIEAGR